MKNNYLITDLGPHILGDHSQIISPRPWKSSDSLTLNVLEQKRSN